MTGQRVNDEAGWFTIHLKEWRSDHTRTIPAGAGLVRLFLQENTCGGVGGDGVRVETTEGRRVF